MSSNFVNQAGLKHPGHSEPLCSVSLVLGPQTHTLCCVRWGKSFCSSTLNFNLFAGSQGACSRKAGLFIQGILANYNLSRVSGSYYKIFRSLQCARWLCLKTETGTGNEIVSILSWLHLVFSVLLYEYHTDDRRPLVISKGKSASLWLSQTYKFCIRRLCPCCLFVGFFFVCFDFWDRATSSPGWPPSWATARMPLNPDFLFVPLKCWECRSVLLNSVYVVPGIKCRALCMTRWALH